MTCPRCNRPIPDLLLGCPFCLAAIEVPTTPTPKKLLLTPQATTPPILVKPPLMEVELKRRENGLLTARMIAGEEIGKNILACHRFSVAARARKFVVDYLAGKFGQSVSVTWRGEA